MLRKLVVWGAIAALGTLAAEREQLFNGRDLSGWQLINPEGADSFVVTNGVMQTTGHKGDAVFTRHKIGNATIHVVYRMSNDKGNSGVFIRIPVIPTNEGTAINQGIEVQIDNRDNDYHCTGVLYSMTKALARPYTPAGEWNTMDITLNGARTIVKVNGVLVTDYDGVSPVPPKVQPWEPDRHPRPNEGYIAVQAHDPSAVIEFKEVSIEPLGK